MVSDSILEIGTVSPTTLDATVGLAVRKSGRTTGLTQGEVSAVDVTVDVQYTKECNKGRQTARFVGQIRITPGSFSDGGDSGSLVVEDIDNDPRPVGLLFAGGSSSTLANPIGRVLECLGVGFSASSVPTAVDCAASGGGGDDGGDGGGKGPPGGNGPPGKNKSLPAGLERASEAKAQHEDILFAVRGVVGTGLSFNENGEPVIEVYLAGPIRDAEREIPTEIEGFDVRVVETGPFVAY